MGYTNWSDTAYESRQDQRKRTKTSAFTYDAHVRSSGVRVVHPQMNPYGVTRESRDSAQHPNSVSIATIFDVTGSMGEVPRVLQTKLGKLMRMLTDKQLVTDPQLLFGAVGDAWCDAVPLQIGQFESGLEMDDDLGKIFLEGGGGGQVYESYELALYFAARKLSMDCFEKRGRKGYLFTIGDEKPYAVVSHKQVNEWIGGELTRDIPVQQIVGEALRKFEYFHIIPTNTAHGRSEDVQNTWRSLLGERVLMLDDEGAVCETIALAIGLCEGTFLNLNRATDEMVNAGYDAKAAKSAASALNRYTVVNSAGKGKAQKQLPPPVAIRI